MIRIFIMLAVAAAAIIFGPIAAGNKGYVLINMTQWTIEMTVVSLVISLLLFFIAFLAIEWVIRKLLKMSNSSMLWLSNRKQRKALQQTSDGMLALAAQDWRSAEKLLSQSARNSHTPELNYLVAAEAAKHQGKTKEQEKYVAQIGDHSSTLAVAMTKARLADDEASRLKAKEELEQWQKKQPKQATLLLQLAQLYQALDLWQEWLDLLPSLKKYTQLNQEQLTQQEQHAYAKRFNQLAQEQGVQALEAYWQGLGKDQKRQPELLASFSTALRQQGGETQERLFEALCKTPHSALLAEWLLTPITEPEEKLMKVKKRYKKESAEHNSLVGLTALHTKRWDEAIHYLNQALALKESPTDRLALAQALEQNGQVQEALSIYKKMVDVV